MSAAAFHSAFRCIHTEDIKVRTSVKCCRSNCGTLGCIGAQSHPCLECKCNICELLLTWCVQHLQHGSQAGRCNGAFSFALLAAPETKKPSCTDLRFHHQFNRTELSRAEPEVDALWSGAKARCVAIRSTPRAERECFCSFWLKHCLHRLYLTVLLCSCSAVSSDVLSYR